jgi:hypothetical protein
MPLNGIVVLKHLDRVLFGSNHLYVFKNPKHPFVPPGIPETMTWEFAQEEIARCKGYDLLSGLTPEQQRAQEQIIELLPLISEANAISEEMKKHRIFDVQIVTEEVRPCFVLPLSPPPLFLCRSHSLTRSLAHSLTRSLILRLSSSHRR